MKQRARKQIIRMVLLLMLFTAVGGYTAMAAETTGDDPCPPKSVALTVGAGIRSISDSLYSDVFDGTATTISVDLAYRLMQSLEIFAHTDLLSVTGETTYTGEETTLKITPLELGARFLLNSTNPCRQKLFIYVGGGGGYYMIDDTHPVMGQLKENRIGFFVEGGARYYLGGSLFLDGKIKQVLLKSEDGVNLGGMAVMGGVGFAF